MRWLAIDNGKSGAVALIDDQTGEVKIEDVQLDAFRELDCNWFFHLMVEWEPRRGIIEQCHNNNGLVEMGGKFIGVAELAGVRVQKVSARTWMKAILGQSTSDKHLSVTKCLELYPSAPINRPSPKGRVTKPDHNRAESVLLACYLKTLHI